MKAQGGSMVFFCFGAAEEGEGRKQRRIQGSQASKVNVLQKNAMGPQKCQYKRKVVAWGRRKRSKVAAKLHYT